MFTLDNLGTGIQTLILGMLVVFLALAIIWLVVALVGMAFKKKSIIFLASYGHYMFFIIYLLRTFYFVYGNKITKLRANNNFYFVA